MSKHDESAAAEVTKADPAGLVGKDELGESSLYSNFKPAPSESVEKILMGMVGYESESQVDGTWVRLSGDDFVVAVHHAPTDIVNVLWVEEGETKSFFSKRANKEITFREKRLTGYQYAGKGEGGLAEARALVGEFREAVEIAVMRALGGVARIESDEDEDAELGVVGEPDQRLEEEMDEMRSLMEG